MDMQDPDVMHLYMSVHVVNRQLAGLFLYIITQLHAGFKFSLLSQPQQQANEIETFFKTFFTQSALCFFVVSFLPTVDII